MNAAVITDTRQDNIMIRDCYDDYCCIINQNIILANANSLSAPSPIARATEDFTQLDH